MQCNFKEINKRIIDNFNSDEAAKDVYDYFNLSDCEYFLVGGAARDVIRNKNPRDFDFIISEIDNSCFEEYLSSNNIHYVKNNFNGYKLKFEKYDFDIWSMQDHFLYKKKIYKNSHNTLGKTTFTNYDSIFINLRTGSIIGQYESFEESNELDLVGNDRAIQSNPTPYMNVAKIFKIKEDEKCTISDRVDSYIKHIYYQNEECFFSEVENEYKRHYREELPKNIKDSLSITIGLYEKQLQN